jgi:hypothetical protein
MTPRSLGEGGSTPNQRVNSDAQAAGFGPLLERRLRASRWATELGGVE